MAEAVLIWAYVSLVPFTWCRVFFGLRGHRSLGRRWLLASAIAFVWPLYWLQFGLWHRLRKPDTAAPDAFADQVEAELHALYP